MMHFHTVFGMVADPFNTRTLLETDADAVCLTPQTYLDQLYPWSELLDDPGRTCNTWFCPQNDNRLAGGARRRA
jgi:hypothetical protein